MEYNRVVVVLEELWEEDGAMEFRLDLDCRELCHGDDQHLEEMSSEK